MIVDAAIDYVNASASLALYHFDLDRARIERVLDSTVAGGSTSTTPSLVSPSNLLGGVGPSGMGAYHGHEGFRLQQAQAGLPVAPEQHGAVQAALPRPGRLLRSS